MFFDGDGDRIDVYRGDGTYLSSSFVYAAILPEIRRRFPGQGLGVFADLKSNPLAIIEMARTGVTVDVIRNGHSQIKESLNERPRPVRRRGGIGPLLRGVLAWTARAVLHREHALHRPARGTGLDRRPRPLRAA